VKVAVLGSNAFSGASFADYALKQGADVLGISRSSEPHRVFLPYRWSGHDCRFAFYSYDLNRQLDEIIALIKRERPQYVVNFAAQSMVGESWKNPEHWFMTNVVSTVRLHEQLRHCEFLERYVHITTPEVYGSTPGFIKEDFPFNPNTPYAVSRAAADMSLRTFHQTHGFPVVYTRAANVYGPGQQLYRIIPRTILFIKVGRKLGLHGGGHASRSFIHIQDVCSATWRVMMDGKIGESYHISTNEIVSIGELVQRICGKMGVRFEDAATVVDDRPGKDSAYMLDSSKLRGSLGWHDEIDLETGLDDCIRWVAGNLDDLRHQPLDYVHKP